MSQFHVVRVLGGMPEHLDQAMPPWQKARNEVMSCVSRCKGDRLVLDS